MLQEQLERVEASEKDTKNILEGLSRSLGAISTHFGIANLQPVIENTNGGDRGGSSSGNNSVSSNEGRNNNVSRGAGSSSSSSGGSSGGRRISREGERKAREDVAARAMVDMGGGQEGGMEGKGKGREMEVDRSELERKRMEVEAEIVDPWPHEKETAWAIIKDGRTTSVAEVTYVSKEHQKEKGEERVVYTVTVITPGVVTETEWAEPTKVLAQNIFETEAQADHELAECRRKKQALEGKP